MMPERIAYIVAVFLICASARAQLAVSAPPVDRPAPVTCTNLELGKQVPCPDTQLFFNDGQGPVQMAFNARDFGKLNTLYDQWCTGKDRFPDGRWYLSQYEQGLSGNFSAWNAWARDLETIKSWQRATPESAAALFAEAVYWQAYAWKARGAGYASTVPKEGWELFRERLAKAEAALTAPQMVASKCPAPSALRLNVLIELGADEEALGSVYAQAARAYPEYHGIYFAMARHFEPKWGGSTAKYELFASSVAEQTKKFEGMGMYARLYWIVDSRQGIPFTNDPLAPPSWKKLKAGYEDLIRLYPSSIHNLGKFAGVACRSTDGELYRKLRTKIDGYEESTEMVDSVDVCDRRHKWVREK